MGMGMDDPYGDPYGGVGGEPEEYVPSTSSHCGHYLKLTCKKPAPPPPPPGYGTLRLRSGVGEGSNYKGLLEVDKGNGEWGLVCGSNDWNGAGDKNADVACKQLGFVGVTSWTTERHMPYGWRIREQDKKDVILGGVKCAGTETRLVDCAGMSWGRSFCFSQHAVTLKCKTAGGEEHGNDEEVVVERGTGFELARGSNIGDASMCPPGKVRCKVEQFSRAIYLERVKVTSGWYAIDYASKAINGMGMAASMPLKNCRGTKATTRRTLEDAFDGTEQYACVHGVSIKRRPDWSFKSLDSACCYPARDPKRFAGMPITHVSHGTDCNAGGTFRKAPCTFEQITSAVYDYGFKGTAWGRFADKDMLIYPAMGCGPNAEFADTPHCVSGIARKPRVHSSAGTYCCPAVVSEVPIKKQGAWGVGRPWLGLHCLFCVCAEQAWCGIVYA